MSLEEAAKKTQGKDVSHLDDLLADARTEEEEEVQTKRFNVEIPEELHHYIKVQAAKEDRSMKAVFLDAMEMYLSRRA
jgi:predicted HicB family RNase H-like nuclease